MSKLTKRQHYVPQFYLRNFADENHMFYTFDKQYSHINHAGVRGSAKEDWFYEPSGEPTNKIENILCKIETFFASALKTILTQCNKNSSFILNDDEMLTLFLFWVVQLIRSPLSKDIFGERHSKSHSKKDNQDAYCENFWCMILDMYYSITSRFIIKDVEILSTPDEFWTADCPCSATRIRQSKYSDAKQIWIEFPLSCKYYARIIMRKRTCALERIVPPSVSGKIHTISNSETIAINKRLLHSSLRYVYKKNEFTEEEKSALGMKQS